MNTRGYPTLHLDTKTVLGVSLMLFNHQSVLLVTVQGVMLMLFNHQSVLLVTVLGVRLMLFNHQSVLLVTVQGVRLMLFNHQSVLLVTVLGVRFMLFNYQSVLLVEETEVHRPVASHWQTLSQYVVSNTPRHEWGSNSQLNLVVIGTNCIGSYKSNYHTIMTTTAPAYSPLRLIVHKNR
jgi:hypothetical protein